VGAAQAVHPDRAPAQLSLPAAVPSTAITVEGAAGIVP
jgi:hypothetical protein